MQSHSKEFSERIIHDWTESDYYELAESPTWLSLFWDASSRFRRQFEKLDLGVTIELACGRGRHCAQILDRCREIILVDVNRSNIDSCRKRFANHNHVVYLENDGYSLDLIHSEYATSLYCYDAMVHFELESIIGYLVEIFRVLKQGGQALLHHSNYDKNPGAAYTENFHWRNFMSQNLFIHLSRRTGFSVLYSECFNWADDDHVTDCLTLLRK
ncbi:MAG: class I SAM-dependent methyltransferase [Syntrophobacteraceae bacterium]